MTNFLITCDEATENPLTLAGVGNIHPNRFVAYGETDHQAIGVQIEAVNVHTQRMVATDVRLQPSVARVSRILWRSQLPAGAWLLRLRTVAQGVVATRAVEVKDEEADA